MPDTSENRDKAFDLIYNHALNPMYNGWTDWRMDLLSAAVPLCGNRANRGQLEQYLSQQQSADTDTWNSRYRNHSLQDLQAEIIEQFDGNPQVTAYMERHLGNDTFRRKLIETAISNRQYDKALHLCADSVYPGGMANCRPKYSGAIGRQQPGRRLCQDFDRRDAQAAVVGVLQKEHLRHFILLHSSLAGVQKRRG